MGVSAAELELEPTFGPESASTEDAAADDGAPDAAVGKLKAGRMPRRSADVDADGAEPGPRADDSKQFKDPSLPPTGLCLSLSICSLLRSDFGFDWLPMNVGFWSRTVRDSGSTFFRTLPDGGEVFETD